jgi:hypothetical protein
MLWLGLLALVALLFQATGEYIYLAQKPNPYPHGPGLPTLREDPFDPTRSYIDLSLLPWTLDPAQSWPPELRAQAGRPCGALAVLSARYPLWRPPRVDAESDPVALCAKAPDEAGRLALLRQAGWIAEERMTLEGQVLVLERGETWDLALVPERGLQMRRRGQP